MNSEIVVALSTFPSLHVAGEIARTIVQEKLAACANLLGNVDSIYWWEGQVENASEVLVLFKLPADGYPRFSERLQELHPYDVPEILRLDVADGLPAYVEWVLTSCKKSVD